MVLKAVMKLVLECSNFFVPLRQRARALLSTSELCRGREILYVSLAHVLEAEDGYFTNSAFECRHFTYRCVALSRGCVFSSIADV